MDVDLNLQVAGQRRVDEILKEALQGGGYSRLRVMVAFARWSGIFLVQDELEQFAADGEIEIVAGIDLGGTTTEALEYLMRLPNTSVHVFRSGRQHVVFHPKAYAFDGDDGWSTVLGSSNWTTGGTFTNVELVTTLTGVGDEQNPFDPAWAQLTDPQPPIEDHHLELLDDDLLESLAPSLDRYSNRPPDRGDDSEEDAVEPIEIGDWPPSPGRPPDRRREAAPPRAAPSSAASEDQLYMEVWGETGGGTQVQFPKEVVEHFFRATAGVITWIRLETPSGTETQRIQVFSNDTFRIPLRFLSGVDRPAVLRMRRLGEDHYRVEVRSTEDRGYKAWLSRCDTQTRSDSKRFGLE